MMKIEKYGKEKGYVKSQSRNMSRPYKEVEITVVLKRQDSNPSIARIVCNSPDLGDVEVLRKILYQICEIWPQGKEVDCLLTPAGFLYFDCPASFVDIQNNKNPPEPEKALYLLTKEAEKKCDELMDKKLREELLTHTQYITLGIDSECRVGRKKYQIELVGMISLQKNQYHWAGKSYPHSGGEKKLLLFPSKLHIVDDSFFGKKVLLLYCHDLTVFNHRRRFGARQSFFFILSYFNRLLLCIGCRGFGPLFFPPLFPNIPFL
jgi:hypothetical protein